MQCMLKVGVAVLKHTLESLEQLELPCCCISLAEAEKIKFEKNPRNCHFVSSGQTASTCTP